MNDTAQHLTERLNAINRRFAAALDLQSRDTSFGVLAPFADNWSRADLQRGEALDASPQQFDLVTSVLTLQTANDLPGVLVQIRRALKPDGLFLAAVFSGDTLKELRDAFAHGESETTGGIAPRVAPLPDLRDLAGLLQRAGFALPVADSEKTIVHYRKFETLVQDLRDMGETNVLAERSRRFLRRDTLAATLARYRTANSEPDGRLRATFEISYLTGWSPDQSQPKALRPGSARRRLADALKTVEHKIGPSVEKP